MAERDDPSIFTIDLGCLDEEWVKQPDLYHDYAKELANARRVYEEAKARLKLTDAELELEIRKEPKAFDLVKVTESVIAAVVEVQEGHQKAVSAVIKARHRVDLLEGAVTALDHRKRALEKAVDLWSMSYFAEPRSKNAQAAVESGLEKRKAKRSEQADDAPVRKEKKEKRPGR